MTNDFSKVPVNQFYGYRLVSRSPDRAEGRMPLKPGYTESRSTGAVAANLPRAMPPSGELKEADFDLWEEGALSRSRQWVSAGART